jgi:hypothetical protein
MIKTLLTLRIFLEDSDLLLDGLLGTGIKLPLRNEAALVLQGVASILVDLELTPMIVAVDCPSGVDCDTGACADETLPADLTITMAAVKQGLLKLPAFEYVANWNVWHRLARKFGFVECLACRCSGFGNGLGFFTGTNARLTQRDVWYGPRDSGVYILYWRGFAGWFSRLSSRCRLGNMAVPEPLYTALAGHIPEATWVTLAHESGFISEHAVDVLLKNFDRATAVLIGPGIGINHPIF